MRVVEQAHDALAKSHSETFTPTQMYSEPHPALFGDGPENTYWQMPHGAGGGVEAVAQWVPGAARIWEQTAHD